MSGTNESTNNGTGSSEQPYTKLGIGPEDAAAASVAQSMAFSAQNEVDAYRNQNTVNMVALGAAYSKWLQNPMMAEQFSGLVEKTKLAGSEPSFENVFNAKSDAKSKAKAMSLPARVFNHFLSSPDSEK